MNEVARINKKELQIIKRKIYRNLFEVSEKYI